MAKTKLKKPSSSPGKVEKGSKGTAIASLLFHVLYTAAYAHAVIYCYRHPPAVSDNPNAKLMGPLKFLTIWGAHFQLLIGILNILVILIGTKKLISLRDSVHHGLSFPFGFIVFGLFWSIFTFNPEMLVPKDRTIFLPSYINHILHTLVGITPLINELFTYQKRRKNTGLIFYTVYFAYMSQLLFFGLYLNFWIYPVFHFLSATGKAAFLVGCMAVGSLIYLAHGSLHSLLWRKRLSES